MTNSFILNLYAMRGILFLIIILVAVFAPRVESAVRKERWKRFAINTSSFSDLQSKYGQVISEASKRYQPFDRPQSEMYCKLYFSRATGDQSDVGTQAFERSVPGTPMERHAKFFSEIDTIADDYLRMTEAERRALRCLLSHHNPVLRGYQYSVGSVLAATKERVWLQRGLTVTSIENCQSDFRDSMEALYDLLNAAKRLGIDWRDDVAMAACLSDDTESLGGGKGTPWKSTKAYLERLAQRGWI